MGLTVPVKTVLKAVRDQKKMFLGSSVLLLTFLHPTDCDFLLHLGKSGLPLILESVCFLLDREGALVTTYRCQQPSPARQALSSVVSTLA